VNLLTVTASAIQHTFQQGSSAWLEHRFGCDNAGDAAAMLGVDPNRSRTDLLDALHIGFTSDVGSFKQGIYDKGHRFEHLARQLAEEILGEDLYPLVLSRDWSEHGIRRPIGASLDGSTIARAKNWEHKSLNEVLAAAMAYEGEAGVHLNDASALPENYRIQMEQQFMVTDAEECLFTASKWADDDTLIEARHCIYRPDPVLRARIVAGWMQLEADLATHQPVVHQEIPKGIKGAALGLPAVVVHGSVVSSDLAAWRARADAWLANINMELTNDEQFGQADVDAKLCRETSGKVMLLRDQVLGQMADVNEVVSTLEQIAATITRRAIDLENRVSSRKVEIRKEIADEGANKLRTHIHDLNQRMADLTAGEAIMPLASHPKIAADFDKAIRNKRTVKSLHDSVNAELARAKIAASALADQLEKNLKLLHANKEHRALFADWRNLVFKECEDFALVVKTRIDAHVAEQERQRQAAAEAERLRLEREAEAQRQAPAPAPAAFAPAPGFAGAPDVQEFPAPLRGNSLTGLGVAGAVGRYGGPVARLAPVETVVSGTPANVGPTTGARQVVPARIQYSGDMVRLGEISERLGLGITQARMQALGFHPARTERSSVLYHVEDLPAICDAVIRHVAAVRNSLHQPAREAA